nr:ATP synthase F0 subunit 8 [Sagra femorata]
MPQMSPLSWLILMMFFITTLMLVNTMNYFNVSYYPNKYSMKNQNYYINWKW